MQKKIWLPFISVILIAAFSTAIALTQGDEPVTPDEPTAVRPGEGVDAPSTTDPAPNAQAGGEPGPAGPAIVQANVEAAFTYQGRLSDDGSPVTGDYQFTFQLYDDPAAGVQVGSTVTQVIPVEDGLFTTSLDFGNVFTGTAHFLEIAVRPDGSTDPLTVLDPRQPLTAAPYALSLRPGADIIGDVSGDANLHAHNTAASGSSYAIIGETDSASFGAAAILGRITSTSPGSYSTAVRGINEGTGGLGIGVWGEQNGSGWGLYGSSETGYAAYLASTGAGGRGIYARGGSGVDADLILGGSDSSASGDDGRILSDPAYSGSDIFLSSNDAVVVQLDQDGGGEDADFAVQDKDGNLIFNVDEAGEASFYSPSGLEYLQVHEDTGEGGGEITLRNGSGATAMWIEASENGSDGSQLVLYDSTGAATITLDSEFGAGGPGTITTEDLVVTGGADLAEHFAIKASPAGVRPAAGYVVSIDPNAPGDLIVSSRAYERTAAGVVSGAGELGPAISMGHSGSGADARFPVALTGRVYVWVDATFGPVEAGDLLTTSDTPGHAMVVSDYARAQGAILGKAMTGLESGRGLVLMLVTLQ